jgi:dolichol-phosphate mannosyltransferase
MTNNSGISIIVPTYQERANLPLLIAQIKQLRTQLQPLELIIVDDDSQDGTEDYIRHLPENWIQLISRKNIRDLSSAVIAGFQQANYAILICMDGDLSHPVAAIPEMVKCIQQANVDFVIASRFMPGARIAASWPLLRRWNAAIAKFLAKSFTHISDPMSGFFCLRKTDFLTYKKHLNPVGYKIGLELLVKCRCKTIHEVPIHFAERHQGKSKLTFRERWKYIRHIARLFNYRRAQP